MNQSQSSDSINTGNPFNTGNSVGSKSKNDDEDDDSKYLPPETPTLKTVEEEKSTEKKKVKKQLTFFQRLFAKDIEDDNSEDGSLYSDTSGNSPSTKIKPTSEDEKKILGNMIDPPLPVMGRPVDYDTLRERNIATRVKFRKMMGILRKDAIAAEIEAKNIPVGDYKERVQITQPIMDKMAERKSKKDDKKFVEKSEYTIERALGFRRMFVELMNNNYSGILVRKVEPTNLSETRSIIVHRKKDKHVIKKSQFFVD